MMMEDLLFPPLATDGAGRAALQVCWFCVIASFVVSIAADNYSQVDKLWSITPPLYIAILAWHEQFKNARVLLMMVVSIVWGGRLTLNFARRGGYDGVFPRFWTGEEDYRWVHVRKNVLGGALSKNPILWQLFNLGFICFFQHFLLFLIAAPAYIAHQNPGVPLNWVDWLLACIILLLVGIEGLADEQQYVFQEEKHRLLKLTGRDLGKLPKPYRDGFLRQGLFSVCRHPAYACEQAIWIAMYLFSANVTGVFLQWSATGAVLLVALFAASSDFSEALSTSKYPLYKEFQRTHCKFLPVGSFFALGKSA